MGKLTASEFALSEAAEALLLILFLKFLPFVTFEVLVGSFR